MTSPLECLDRMKLSTRLHSDDGSVRSPVELREKFVNNYVGCKQACAKVRGGGSTHGDLRTYKMVKSKSRSATPVSFGMNLT